MRRRRNTSKRAGITLIEVILAVALLAVLAQKVAMIVTNSMRVSSTETLETALEDQALLVLRRIGYSVMGSQRDTLVPAMEAPLHSTALRYQVNLGLDDGEVVWSEPEEIGVDEVEDNRLYWKQNPDDVTERRIVWTNLVAPFLEGELPNGMDDNGNGLIDESGLCFVIDRNSVNIRMTLERRAADGTLYTQTVETTVTCRNKPEGVGL